LIAHAIRNSRRSGDLGLVPFGGSGSTVIACEKIGRLARLGEIDPIYVDVTIYRWQKFTGNPAVLSGDGRTFAEIARSRERPKGPGMNPRLP
jgi:DNA modification methylase